MTGLLTAQEAAGVMRCHEKTVRRMILRGELEADYVAGRYLINPANLPVGGGRPARVPPPRPRKPVGRFAQMAEEMDAA